MGHDAVHTQSYSQGIFMSDTDIRKLALKENRIIITKDSDFTIITLNLLRCRPFCS